MKFYFIDVLSMTIFTVLGLINREVTVFYFVYLFWFLEFARTLVDSLYLYFRTDSKERNMVVRTILRSFFPLAVYFIFIVVLFGFMLNWGENDLFLENMMVFSFRNWFFNSNILLFIMLYSYFRFTTGLTGLNLQPYNRKHIILHISIIFAAIIQMILIPRLTISKEWASVLVILPFLLLRIFIERPRKESVSKQPSDKNEVRA